MEPLCLPAGMALGFCLQANVRKMPKLVGAASIEHLTAKLAKIVLRNIWMVP